MSSAQNKKTLLLYLDYADKFADLTDTQFGQLIRAAIAYQKTGETPKINDTLVKFAFSIVKVNIDENNVKYAEVSEARREAVLKRWEKEKPK